MPLLSIVIPTYNASLSLALTIESVLEQTFKDFEIIIMDGESSDTTLEIAKKYKDGRIRIYSEKDDGVYDAMNQGIDKAKGEWLYFLGSDDQLFDDSVLELIHKSVKKQDLDFIYGDAFFIGLGKVRGNQFDRQRLKTDNICHQAIFYRKRLFDRLGKYNTQFKIWADWDFNIRCFSLPEIRTLYINQILVNYDDRGGLSSVNNTDEAFVKLLPSYVGEDIVILKSPIISKLRTLFPEKLKKYIKTLIGKKDPHQK